MAEVTSSELTALILERIEADQEAGLVPFGVADVAHLSTHVDAARYLQAPTDTTAQVSEPVRASAIAAVDEVLAQRARLFALVLADIRSWGTDDDLSDREVLAHYRNTVSLPWENVAGGHPYEMGDDADLNQAWLVFLGATDEQLRERR